MGVESMDVAGRCRTLADEAEEHARTAPSCCADVMHKQALALRVAAERIETLERSIGWFIALVEDERQWLRLDAEDDAEIEAARAALGSRPTEDEGESDG